MRQIAEQMPHARFVEIAAAGHMSPLEQPEAVNAAIQEFLSLGHALCGVPASCTGRNAKEGVPYKGNYGNSKTDWHFTMAQSSGNV